MSICSMTWLRSPMASSTVLKPMPKSARPGIGRVRDTDPGAMTISSYPISRAPVPSSPVARVVTVAVRLAWSMRWASPMTIVQSLRTRRSGTTTWRGEIEPAAASGRKGWYVM
ncbi:hypothetical protein SBADM41S_08919 [Streptomyces badius]